MMHAITDTRPRRIVRHGRGRGMDITLHMGAHRTATTSFQHYMRLNAPALARHGVGYWGPLRIRTGRLAGLQATQGGDADSTRRHIATALDRAEKRGITHLIVSEENIAGHPARNMREARLYPGIGDRLARVARVFDHRISRVVLSVRPQQDYWPSLLAYAVHRGHPLPDAAQIGRIARSPRLWQDVVRDVAAAQGGRIRVQDHATDPAAMLFGMTGGAFTPPSTHAALHLNAAPHRAELRKALTARGTDASAIPGGAGRWQPFDTDQQARLREAWLDDEFWLAAGAGGLATRAAGGRTPQGTTHQPERAGHHPPHGHLERGHGNDIEERRMVGTR